MVRTILDSYISYIATRFVKNNAQVTINGLVGPQKCGGVVDVADWPQAPVKEGVLYLVVQHMHESGRSKVQVQCSFTCQWTWLVIGTDIQANQQSTNRGDRYATNLQIEQNLREASYPGFCQKMLYSADNTGEISAVPATSVYPVSATERILWDKLRFMPRTDSSKSGVLYNAAGVVVVGWDDLQTPATLNYADTIGAQITGT